MAKLFRKGKVKKIVAIVLGLVSVAGAVFGVSALAKYAKEEQKTIKPAFSVGGLTETGVYEETDDTIYTKDSFEAKGLEIKLDFDSNVKYQVFFYDELDKFISCTEVYTESQDISVPLEARARLEVTPIWGADAPLEKEIKWYETAKYANQLEIRVDKRQELLESDFEKISILDETVFALIEGNAIGVNGELVEDALRMTFTTVLDKNYTKMYVLFGKSVVASDGFSFAVKYVDGTVKYFDFYEAKETSIDNLVDVEEGATLYFTIGKNSLSASDVYAMLYLA